MMYVLGWLLILGGIGVWFFLGMLLGSSVGNAMIGLGVLLAALGAIVQAIKDLAKTVSTEAAKDRDTYKTGVDSLWKQLDAVRSAVAQPAQTVAAPVGIGVPSIRAALEAPPSAAGGIGLCPSCGKLRGMNVPKCVYCGSDAPTQPEGS